MDPRQLAEMSFLGAAIPNSHVSDDDEDKPLITAAMPPPKKRAPPKKKAVVAAAENTEAGAVESLVGGSGDEGVAAAAAIAPAPPKAPRKRAPPKPKNPLISSDISIGLCIGEPQLPTTTCVAAPLSSSPSASFPGSLLEPPLSSTATTTTSLCSQLLRKCAADVAAGSSSMLSGAAHSGVSVSKTVETSDDDEDAPLISCLREASEGSGSNAPSTRQASMESISGHLTIIASGKQPTKEKATKKEASSKSKSSSSITKPPKKVAATQDEVNAAVLGWFRREMKPATPQSCVDGLQSKYSKTFVLRSLEELLANSSLAIKDIKKVRLYFLNRDQQKIPPPPSSTIITTIDNVNPTADTGTLSSAAAPLLAITLEMEIASLEADISSLVIQSSQLGRLQALLSSLKSTEFYRNEIAAAEAELQVQDAKLKRIEDSLNNKIPSSANPSSISSTFDTCEKVQPSLSAGGRGGGRDLGWFRLKRPREEGSSGVASNTSQVTPVIDSRTMAQDALALVKQWVIRKRLCTDMLESLNQHASSLSSTSSSLLAMLCLDEDSDERLTPDMCRDRIPKQLLQLRR